MKKLILLMLTAILTLSSGCGLKTSQLMSVPAMKVDEVVTINKQEPLAAEDQKSLDEAIGTFLEEKLGFKSIDGKVFEAHELYGTEKKENKTYAYLWCRVEEFAFENNEMVKGSGSSLPVVVVLEYSEKDKYTATEYMVPKDGDLYTASVKELFPEAYHEKILTRANINGLEEILKQKAANYFSTLPKETAETTKSDNADVIKDGDMQEGTGTYTGQIDNNSIEIKTSSASGEQIASAYRLSEEVKNAIAKLSLKTGDKIKFKYTKNGYDQLVISEIEKE